MILTGLPPWKKPCFMLDSNLAALPGCKKVLHLPAAAPWISFLGRDPPAHEGGAALQIDADFNEFSREQQRHVLAAKSHKNSF